MSGMERLITCFDINDYGKVTRREGIDDAMGLIGSDYRSSSEVISYGVLGSTKEFSSNLSDVKTGGLLNMQRPRRFIKFSTAIKFSNCRFSIDKNILLTLTNYFDTKI